MKNFLKFQYLPTIVLIQRWFWWSEIVMKFGQNLMLACSHTTESRSVMDLASQCVWQTLVLLGHENWFLTIINSFDIVRQDLGTFGLSAGFHRLTGAFNSSLNKWEPKWWALKHCLQNRHYNQHYNQHQNQPDVPFAVPDVLNSVHRCSSPVRWIKIPHCMNINKNYQLYGEERSEYISPWWWSLSKLSSLYMCHVKEWSYCWSSQL